MQRSYDNPITPRSVQRSRLGDNLDPSLRSFIDNCVVPILVKEYLASRQVERELASAAEPMAECGTQERSSDEVAE